ncbi:MAG TPA: OmpA family protein [Flavobacterium sp.]|jgi:outer membrane protein OmpA-like peptidoglycan-associated protein
MKNYIYILFLLTGAFSGYGQKVSQKNADLLFAKKSYVKAAEQYEQVEENKQVLMNLGDCYYFNGQMIDAGRVYGKLFLSYNSGLDPEYFFKYAHALMGTTNYKKADSVMALYNKYPVDTPKFIRNLINNIPYNYLLQPMAKNTSNGDFGMSFFREKVVFASLRNGKGETFGWNDKPYLDLFSATISDQNLLTEVEAFPATINTKTHESSATFSADGKIMYFNRTNEKQVKVGEEKVANIKIFKAEFIGDKWENVTEVPFNSDTYSVEHPALTKDGKQLYFASDMPGSLGSFDIYVVDINEDGTYGIPKNLGETINSIHREQFPTISDDGTLLYFASDGHQGIGGLDIFMSKLYDGVWAKPLNLGETINSGMDDFGYAVDEKTDRGYLSSNRKGSDNLYSFQRLENENRFVVEGDVKDKNTKEPLPGTTVTLFDEDGKLVGQMVVGAKADYLFNTEPYKKYRIQAVRDFYIPHSEEFTTNEDGKVRYAIELFVECYDDAEEIITKRQDGRIQIVLENIYFDLNKWEIKPEAARVLDVLYDLLVKYPEMEIELGAHTDSRATATYNLMLSDRRAAATMDYIISRGIDGKRMKSKGYGEAVPLIPCDSGLSCTEAEHSINRRCEFIITK